MGQAIFIADTTSNQDITWALEDRGFSTVIVSGLVEFLSLPVEERPDVVLVDYSYADQTKGQEVARRCHHEGIPVLALVPKEALGSYDFTRGGDDFLTIPCTVDEVLVRIEKLLWKVTSNELRDVRKFGDLSINLERYEVSLRSKPILLTYKEYQLLVLLASSPGRVYSREALLSRIWGYDYLGGARTVDVHIRRLRSKLTESQHSFIETIWNVGYRFRSPDTHSKA
jgi:DNA-binding response OmpR family regulator